MPPRVKKREPSRKARSLRIWAWFGLAAAGMVLCAVVWLQQRQRAAAEPGGKSPLRSANETLEGERKVFAQYGGSENCRSCHQEAYDFWASSNHGLAERAPNRALDQDAFMPARSFKLG